MKSNWTLTKLLAAGSLAVLTLVMQLLGGGIVAITGIPLTGGIFNGLVSPIMTVFCLLIIDQFGAGAVMYTVLGLLNLPLPISGTAGFLPKVPSAIVAGIIADLLYLILKRNKLIATLVIGAFLNLWGSIVIIELGLLFKMPGIEQSARLFHSPLLIGAAIMGALGGYLGLLVYDRLKDTAVAIRIQGK